MSTSSSRPYTFDRVVHLLAGAALLAGVIWLINSLHNVLLPFFVACLISYLLYPIVQLNARVLHLKGQVIPSLLTIVEMTVLLGLLIYFFVPSIIKEIHELQEVLKRGSLASATLPFVPDEISGPVKEWIKTINIEKIVRSSHFQDLLSSGTSVLSWTVNMLLHTFEWLMTFVYVIFILVDYKSLTSGFRYFVPKKYRQGTIKVFGDIGDNMNRYFRGQITIGICAAILYSIGFSIVGIPMAIVIGMLIGVLYIIPYFQYISVIPVTLICLIDSMAGTAHFWTQLGECGLVYVVSQCICDYVLTPHIMGKALGMNPAIILLSLSVWGSLLGMIGMIIALPVTALLIAYYKEYIDGDEAPISASSEKQVTR